MENETMAPELRAQLQGLVEKWKGQARAKFRSADLYEKGTMERRALEFGAMNNYNCAMDLMKALGVDEPAPEAVPAREQRQSWTGRRQPS